MYKSFTDNIGSLAVGISSHTLDVTLDGYTPIGILEHTSNHSDAYLNSYYFNSNILNYRVKNEYAQSVVVTLKVLYKKS